MSRLSTAGWMAALTTLACLSGCAPPKVVDYSVPDAAPAPDAPLPVAVTPDDGAEDVVRRPIVRITFDQQLDSRTIRQSNLDFISGPLDKWTLSYYDPVNMQIVAWPSSRLLRHTTWYFYIRQGILGLNGSPVTPQVLTTFRTGDNSGSDVPYQDRSFDKEIAPIFNTHCVSCHGGVDDGVAGLKLDSKESIEQTALEKPSTQWPDWQRIAPSQPGESYLLYKVIGYENIAGMPMPRSMNGPATQLTMAEKTALMEWIAAGAIFFDPVSEDE